MISPPANRSQEREQGYMLLCRDTSRILNTEAPRRAALVRKPARREWAPKSAALSPIRAA
jgi:hypothetical protein